MQRLGISSTIHGWRDVMEATIFEYQAGNRVLLLEFFAFNAIPRTGWSRVRLVYSVRYPLSGTMLFKYALRFYFLKISFLPIDVCTQTRCAKYFATDLQFWFWQPAMAIDVQLLSATSDGYGHVSEFYITNSSHDVGSMIHSQPLFSNIHCCFSGEPNVLPRKTN